LIAPGAWITRAKCQPTEFFPVSRSEISRFGAAQLSANKIEIRRTVEVTSSLKGRCREDGVEEDECADENGDGFHDDRIFARL
jgi:hypothetical protein